MGKRILFVMVDLDSASGICVQNVARELSARGHEIHILTKSPEYNPKPYLTEYGARVHAVTSGWLDRVRWKYKDVDGLCGKAVCRLAVLLERVRVVLCYPTWPLKDFGFCRRLVKQAKKIAREEHVDIVIPSYNTIDSLIAAKSVKNEYPKILYIPYMLDAFYGGQKPRLMSEDRKRKKALAWEKRLFARADGIVMMKPAQGAYARDGISPEYLARTVFLDLPMLHRRNLPVETLRLTDRKVFLFAGSMPRNIRDPQFLLDVFRTAADSDWQLWFVGPSDFESVIDAAARSDSRIRRIGKVSYDQAVAYMASADFLVNIGNTLAYMVPSKIFEYMSFGKPMISTVKIPEDPCLPYLNLYEKALVLDEQGTVSENAEKLRRFVQTLEQDRSDRVTALTEPGMPLYANTPAAFADYIQSMTEST